MIIGFIIWSIVAVIFLFIGINSWKSINPVGFYTFAKKPDVKDVKKYNHAVSALWIAGAAVLEIAGVPILFMEQNSPLFIPLILAVVMLVVGMMIVYARIEAKYRI